MTEIDQLWARVVIGDRRACGDWMGRVERPIRRSLAPFARAVDAEGIVQEALMRMWLFASERGATLTGENASLRFAIVLARGLARNEARKRGRELLLPPADLPEPALQPEPPADPLLAHAIRECFGKLASKPLAALRARLEARGGQPDTALARALGMTANTFLQNIVRARRAIEKCLEGRGISIEEALR